MKNKLLSVFTYASVGMLLFTLLLHIIGYFAYWDSRWHLWAYIPLFVLLILEFVWMFVSRVPLGTFRTYCRTTALLCTVLLLIFMFCMFCLNIITTKDGAGYMDDEGNGYLDPYYEYEISGEEYRTLRRAAYQMTTEPMVSLAAFPALFFTTRLRAEPDLALRRAEQKSSHPLHRRKKRKH